MQSVLAIPFVVPPVAEAAGDSVPSTDGAFLMSFADEATDPPKAGDARTDPGVPGFAPVLPFALFPGHGAAGPFGDPAGAVQADAVAEGTMPLLHDVRLLNGTVTDADGLSTALTAPETLLGASLPEAGPLVMGDGRETSGAEGLFPATDLPGRAIVREGHPSQAVAPEVTQKPSVAPPQSDAAGAGGGAWAVSPPSAERPKASADAGLRREAGADFGGLRAEPTAAASGVSPGPEQGFSPAESRVAAVAVTVPPTARLPKHAESGMQAPDATGASNNVGEGSAPPETTRLTSETCGVEAAAPTADGQAADAADNDLMAQPVALGQGAALPQWLVSSPWDGRPEAELMADQPTDPTSIPDVSASDNSPQTAAPPIRPPASPAGFWERLLTGLSVALPDGQALANPVTARNGETVRDQGPDGILRADVQAAALAIPTVAAVRIAPGLALFAMGQAQRMDPATDPVTDGDLSDLAAAGASFPGSLLQGLSLPLSSSPAVPQLTSAPLPVPQIANQITAALSQSADGATELALSPEELGHVRLRLERDAKHPERMVVHITFERPETLDLFRRHAGELADALRDAGYAGADIGFGQQDGGAGTPDRSPAFAAPDYGSGASVPTEAQTPDSPPPRLMAGASLDLRL